MEKIFLIFVIVMLVLQGLGKLLETLKPPADRPPKRRAPPPQGAARPRQAEETPFEALIRMFEPVEEPPPAAPPPQRHQPPPPARVRTRSVPVARPVPVARRISDEGAHGGHLQARHLRGAVETRHLQTRIGSSRIGGTRLTDEAGPAKKRKTLEERLETMKPWQRAIVYTEIFGPPRSKTGVRRNF